MKLREHFLLGTNHATISCTAKGDEDRHSLFVYSMTAIMARYEEEFGKEAALTLIEALRTPVEDGSSSTTWRLRDEDSCWSEAKRQIESQK